MGFFSSTVWIILTFLFSLLWLLSLQHGRPVGIIWKPPKVIFLQDAVCRALSLPVHCC